jgi:DHA3 family tetracycline resistance protein-like MFS transporter
VVTRLFEKRLDSSNPAAVARAMMGLTSLLGLGIILFAFSPALVFSIAAVWLVTITRNVMSPLYDAWVNQRLDSDTRATVISMSGQVDAIGQIASGPLAGLVSLWSVRAAIVFAGTLLAPALPLIARANRLHSEEDLINPE